MWETGEVVERESFVSAISCPRDTHPPAGTLCATLTTKNSLTVLDRYPVAKA
jgi:hypothetical protein